MLVVINDGVKREGIFDTTRDRYRGRKPKRYGQVFAINCNESDIALKTLCFNKLKATRAQVECSRSVDYHSHEGYRRYHVKGEDGPSCSRFRRSGQHPWMERERCIG